MSDSVGISDSQMSTDYLRYSEKNSETVLTIRQEESPPLNL